MSLSRAAAALVVAAALAGGIVVLAVSGDSDDPAGHGLRWEGRPEMVSPSTLPRDGIVAGRVRNESLRRLRLQADDMVVIDDRGRRWRASGRFMAGFAHGLWPPGQRVAPGSDAERERIGEIATLEPGEQAPLTVAWRRPEGGGRPIRIEIGDGVVLPIPAGRRGV